MKQLVHCEAGSNVAIQQILLCKCRGIKVAQHVYVPEEAPSITGTLAARMM